jgi:NADH-quinone oxidoreductase subunit N
MTGTNMEPLALLPEMLLLMGAVVTLLTGSYLPRHRQWPARLPAVAALAGSLVAGAAARTGRTVYTGTYALDGATTAARVIVPAAALLVLALSVGRVRGNRRETEFSVLVLLASLGSVVLAGANDLLVLAAGYLLATVPLYALAGWARDARGAEAAMKLYLLGALLSAAMLLGITVLYGVAGGATGYVRLASGLPGAPAAAVAMGLVALLAGLLFKAGAVPAHFWIPDAATGAAVAAAAFLTTVPKVGGLIAMYRVVSVVPEATVDWRPLVAVFAAVSMTLGNLAAFPQTDPRRLLGYSTISQVGYVLMAVTVAERPEALRALLFYLAAYASANLGAFAVAAALPDRRTLGDYRGLGHEHPWLTAALTVCLLSLVGTPPTAVFVGKLTVFSATWDAGWAWLAVVAGINTVASLFYYLRWIVPALSPKGRAAPMTAENWALASAGTAAAATLFLGVGAGAVLAVLSDTLVR